MGISALPQPLEEPAACRVAAAMALDGLDDVAGGLIRRELVAVQEVELPQGEVGRLILVKPQLIRSWERGHVDVSGADSEAEGGP